MTAGASKVVASLPLSAFPAWNMHLLNDLLDILTLLAALLYVGLFSIPPGEVTISISEKAGQRLAVQARQTRLDPKAASKCQN